MSGASGKVPAVIHLSPEALPGPDGVSGPLAYLQNGDIVRVCAVKGEAIALVDEVEWASRTPAVAPPPAVGVGRELFALFRHHADEAEKRSEEHTSELQSLMRISYAVFCLKKKTTNIRNEV